MFYPKLYGLTLIFNTSVYPPFNFIMSMKKKREDKARQGKNNLLLEKWLPAGDLLLNLLVWYESNPTYEYVYRWKANGSGCDENSCKLLLCDRQLTFPIRFTSASFHIQPCIHIDEMHFVG